MHLMWQLASVAWAENARSCYTGQVGVSIGDPSKYEYVYFIFTRAICQPKIWRRLCPYHDSKISLTTHPRLLKQEPKNYHTYLHAYCRYSTRRTYANLKICSGGGLMCGDGSVSEMKSESCSTVSKSTYQYLHMPMLALIPQC